MKKAPNKETAVLTTVYPGVGKFLKDYFDSLEGQTSMEFDLLIANDKLDGLTSFLSDRNLNYLIIDVEGSPSSNRRELIRNAINSGYKKLIFSDSDDICEKNRVEIVSNLLDTSHIVVNDLNIVDNNGAELKSMVFSERYDGTKKISLPDILTGNMMGLSNTAVKAEVLQGCPALKTGDPIAFDWYLWSTLLLIGYEAKFTSETSTNYRIYDNNVAGLPQPLSEINVARGVEVKRQHYELMAKLDDLYSELSHAFQDVNKRLKQKAWRKKYLNGLKKHAIDNHIWWENIRTPAEVGIK